MIQISDEAIEMLIKKVIEDHVEVHLEFTQESTNIEIMPWKPFEYRCPYAGVNNGKTD